jgi:ribonuclease T2
MSTRSLLETIRPDNCDGTYQSNCDATRAYTNITQILTAQGKTALLADMNTYWKDYQGNDESFWEHEWAKHGTCISTFDTDCYTGYTAQEEVGDFFQKTVDLFKGLDTYKVKLLSRVFERLALNGHTRRLCVLNEC